MRDRIVTLILQQAAKAEGSTQALATRLHAPEATLLRWMDGRAQTPLRAFLAVLDFLMQREQEEGDTPAAQGATPALTGQPEKRVFALGPLLARCARCDGTEFRLLAPGAFRLTSPLSCTACGAEAIHGNLLAQLAKDAVHHSRAVAARTQRSVARTRAAVERGTRCVEENEAKNPR